MFLLGLACVFVGHAFACWGGGGGGYRVCSGRNDSCIVAAIVCFLVELVCLVIWYVNFLCGSVVLAG